MVRGGQQKLSPRLLFTAPGCIKAETAVISTVCGKFFMGFLKYERMPHFPFCVPPPKFLSKKEQTKTCDPVSHHIPSALVLRVE